jgi:hypothetical protein
LVVLHLEISIKKQPSPLKNPANQLKLINSGKPTLTLGTFCTMKRSFNLSGIPLFKEAFKLIILSKPSSVKCSLFFINLIIFLNIIKSLYFLVIRG